MVMPTQEVERALLTGEDVPRDDIDVVMEAHELSKVFGSLRAVDSVSFQVGRGEVFGFFGPNGAGKTTTIRLLCGLLPPTAGSAKVCGVDVARAPTRVRHNLAIMPEEITYYEKMTPAGYLNFFRRMAGASRESLDNAASVAEIHGFMSKRFAELSHGQRQKVSIARVLMSDAPIMFLDEPFQGIDIVHRRKLREHLRAFVGRGHTVFYTSHNLIEAEYIVDRFAFIDRGQILTIGTGRELRDKYLLPSYALRVSDLALAQRTLSEGLAVTECNVVGEELHVTLKDAADVPKVTTLLGGAGVALMEMRQLGTMEEVFLRMRQDQGGVR